MYHKIIILDECSMPKVPMIEILGDTPSPNELSITPFQKEIIAQAMLKKVLVIFETRLGKGGNK